MKKVALMASARLTYQIIPFLVLLFALIARPAKAGSPYESMGMFYWNVDAGWETMILDGSDYETGNHGFSAKAAFGVNILYFLGLQIEQDFGFIALGRKYGDAEMLFKGGTLLSWSVFFPEIDEHISIHARVGVGAVYMNAPKEANSNMQVWFALRPALAILWLSSEYGHDAMGGGVEFDYTFATSDSNAFDHNDEVHFFSIQAKFIMTW